MCNFYASISDNDVGINSFDVNVGITAILAYNKVGLTS